MKESILIAAMAFAVLASGCTRKSQDFVYLGQMKGTTGFNAQEKIKGHVKEFKQTFFWAQEVNGKIEKGKRITREDTKTILLHEWLLGSLIEEYSQSGIVRRSALYDENGENYQDYIVDSEGKIIKKILYEIHDTVRVYGKVKYEGENPVLFTAYDAIADSALMSIEYAYDQNGNITKTQTLNNINEPTDFTLWNRDVKGNLVKVQYFTIDGKLIAQFDYDYNDKGERISQHQQNFSTGAVIDYTFTYKYDKMGNYTTIIYHKEGRPFIYCAREINYYD